MPAPLALLVSIVVLAAWTLWVVRSGRAGRWAQAIPVIACVIAGGLELLAMSALRSTWHAVAETSAADKTTVLADGLGRASAYAVGAWTVIAVAALVLVVLTLQTPRDVREPRARVVR